MTIVPRTPLHDDSGRELEQAPELAGTLFLTAIQQDEAMPIQQARVNAQAFIKKKN